MDPLIYIYLPRRDLAQLLAEAEEEAGTVSATKNNLPDRLAQMMEKEPEGEEIPITTADLKLIRDHIPQVGECCFYHEFFLHFFTCSNGTVRNVVPVPRDLI